MMEQAIGSESSGGSGVPIISARHFGYRYRRQDPWVVQAIDLEIAAGDWLLIVGASGSGKTTLLRAFNGTVPHFYGGQVMGELLVAGHDPVTTPMRDLFHHVGVVFQDPAPQVFGATVARELAFGLESLNWSRSRIADQVQLVAHTMGIAHLLDRVPQALSGGEQQLVLLAAILALEPQLLALDEPLAMLDAHSRHRVLLALRTLRAGGTALAIIDHQLDAWADGAVPAEEGLVSADSTPQVMQLDTGAIVRRGSYAEVVGALADGDQDILAGVRPPAVARWWRARFADEGSAPPDDGALLRAAHPPFTLFDAGARLRRSALHSTWANSAPAHSRGAGQRHVGEVVVEWCDVVCTYAGRRDRSPAHGRWFASRSVDSLPPDVVRGVSGVVRAGEVVAILGPNGAGKTTLLRTLNGLVRPITGEVRILGQPVGDRAVADLARFVGYAAQRPEQMLFNPTVAHEIAAGPRALGILSATAQWRATLTTALGLDDLLEAAPFTLSFGQQRRVGIAAALAAHPRIVALDEPTAGLDAPGRAGLVDIIQDLAATGIALLIVTHDAEFAAQTASRWLVMCNGEILADDTPDAIMARPDLLDAAAIEPDPAFLLDAQLARLSGWSAPNGTEVAG